MEVEGVWFEAKGCRWRMRGCILGLRSESEVERAEVEFEFKGWRRRLRGCSLR